VRVSSNPEATADRWAYHIAMPTDYTDTADCNQSVSINMYYFHYCRQNAALEWRVNILGASSSSIYFYFIYLPRFHFLSLSI
jgi:hypothetical protein